MSCNIVCINSHIVRSYANIITVMKSSRFIRNQVNQGIWSFTSEDYKRYTGSDPKDAMRVLRRKGAIFSPVRGLYVIVPEEARISGRVPVERYIDDLMNYIGAPYYAGLLTAAAFYGSAHQSPQVFQVITNIVRRAIHVGDNKIVFYLNKEVGNTPTEQRNTPTGYLRISTPEATFFDIVRFNRRIGGLSQAYAVISEMVDLLRISGLKDTAPIYKLPIVQRGGYLLEIIGFENGAVALEKWLGNQRPIYTYLNPSGKKDRRKKYARWKLILNEDLDTEV